MKRNSVLLVLLLLAYVCCAQAGRMMYSFMVGKDTFPELQKTVYPFIYNYTVQDSMMGYCSYYIVNKLEKVDPRLARVEDIYIKEWSSLPLEKLSTDFDIYLYHIRRTGGNMINMKGETIRVACVYKLLFNPDRKEIIKCFTIQDDKDSIESFRSMQQMINSMGQDIEGKVEKFATDWPHNESSIKGLSIVNLQKGTLLKEVEWFDVYPILSRNPLSRKNVRMYINISDKLIKYKKYNEARLFLLEVTRIFSEQSEAWILLGDAQWAYGEYEDARKSYLNYITLARKSKKTNIPKYIYVRLAKG